MGTILENYLSGGAGLVPFGTDATPPLASVLRDIADDFVTLQTQLGLTKTDSSGVVEGLMAVAPTTPSTQATGVGNTLWNAGNIAAGWVEVGGVLKNFALQDDFNIHTGSFLTGLTSGKSCVAAIVCKNVTGTVTMVAVKGAPATTGTQVAPTTAEIQTAVGSGNKWCKVMECLLNRTGDVTVTESRDLTKRSKSAGLGGLSTALLTIKG
jgi:hypothetical protein